MLFSATALVVYKYNLQYKNKYNLWKIIFFLKHFLDPDNSHEFPQDYLMRVNMVHTEGGFGSQG